ncbi:type VI secretion system protein VasG [Yoonia sediminilitoris]|uniref:Type VI secretion system protein VasG n=1 Tax=Yoonia sediminilitoris TaxID=1286148 RepID=A0A2T6KM83_9RHOB|nr:type VI secretion system ATPase TssH [Yoonia sediminilitoris]PUB17267.1 type VI secretion system protein VasG [Yoonia sediminilitoris]RCW97562.1 type VI secretion system protein VasG [Yoonia sediminilitoris]
MAQSGTSETVKRKELVGKLNPLCLKAFSASASAAKSRGNPYVELVHFVQALAGTERSDFDILLQAADVDRGKLDADITRALDALPRGASSVEEFSDHLFHAIRDAWNMGQLDYGDETVRSAYLLLAMLKTGVLESLLYRISLEFDKLDGPAMAEQLDDLLADSVEGQTTAPSEKKAAPGGQSALELYATDLTAEAKAGKIDPVIGRDPEIRQIVDILMRRRQNNPILTGEAGVGKTAVVEGFALRLERGDVPPQLAGVALWMLDVTLMQAGASMKGEFEKRLKSVIDEVQSSPTPIILFVDEAHTLIGAGGSAGTGDAANILKPALARGELRVVAATTWDEYKQHIEKDPALTRRFQVVKVEEPSVESATRMCRGIAGVLEKHHQVEILDEAIAASVELSHRYIPSRQLPDKAISLLDTACARVAISQHATPGAVEDLQRRITALELEQVIADREAGIGIDTTERMEGVTAALAETRAELDRENARWDAEKALVAEIIDLRAQLRETGAPLEGEDDAEEPADPVSKAETMDALRAKMAELTAAQGENPLILPSVDMAAVTSVIQDWTGIPAGRMMASQAERALQLVDTIRSRVTGQDHAAEMIAARIQTSYAGLSAPEKPMGVFMLCGPSGVGKTETALALADMLYGGEQNLISINMSEYQEAHTVSTLKGAPPGYVGYGKGGVLTEAVRRRPYSVVLLDEVEKAHPDVHEIFFQVFDKGMMDDSEGRRIDFKNTLILLTSNVGSDEIMQMTDGGKHKADLDALNEALRPPLLNVFPPALLGRLVTIPYYPLSDEMIEVIAGHKLKSIAKRLEKQHDAALVIGDGTLDLIKARCTEIESGGRMIDAILTNTLLPELSRQLLDRTLDGTVLTKVEVTGDNDGFHYHFS